jgi:hypothetical protein
MFQKIKNFADDHDILVTTVATAAMVAAAIVIATKLDMIQHPEDYIEN